MDRKVVSRVSHGLVWAFAVFGFVDLMVRGSQFFKPNSKPAQRSDAQTVLMDRSEPLAPNEIIFAGLSGHPPQFIDSGPNRGMGVLENETQEIRKALAHNGYKTRMEYWTPARIAHEFRKGSPVCTYPVEWSDPVQTFAQRPTKIYSIPLKLEGEINRSVTFKSGLKARMERHIDRKNKNGNLDIKSLLADTSLKTLLVRDRDYGPITQWVTSVDARGDQVVRKEFQKNIILLSIHDHSQLIEMLNGDRFDYLFSDQIESADLQRLGLDPKTFARMTYSTLGAETEYDPNLILVSIACADHPTTLKAMPFINQWISLFRGLEWQLNKAEYRQLIDPSTPTFERRRFLFQSAVQKFRGKFEVGNFDQWFPLQQSYFPDLLWLPETETEQVPTSSPGVPSDPAPLRSGPKSPLWGVCLDGQGGVTVSNQAMSALPPPTPLKKTTLWAQMHPYERLKDYLTERQLNQLGQLRGIDGDLAEAKCHPLDFSQPKLPREFETRRLTVFAYGLSEQDVETLLPLFSSASLEGLQLFGARGEVVQKILDRVGGPLKEVNLTSSILTQTSIAKWIRGKGLKQVHLSNTQLSQDQLEEVVENLPLDLESLSLGFQRVGWQRGAALAFGRRGFAELKSVDFENSAMIDSHLLEIAKSLPETLETVRVSNNLLSFKSLRLFFRADRFKRLRDVDVEGNSLATLSQEKLFIAKSRKRVNATGAALGPKSQMEFEEGTQLESLDLSENKLSKQVLEGALSHLAERVKILSLRRTGTGPSSFLPDFGIGGLRSIEHLDLSGNDFGDAGVEALIRSQVKVSELLLAQNKLSKKGCDQIALAWGSELKGLDLSENFLREGDERALENLAKVWGQLRSLSLASMNRASLSDLATYLPPRLETLDLSSNQISDAELTALAPRLSRELRTLDLRFSAFGPKGAKALAQHMPPGIQNLFLAHTPIQAAGVKAVVHALPNTALVISLAKAQLEPKEFKRVIEQLPRGLLELWLTEVHGAQTDLPDVFQALPSSLTTLRFYGLPLSEASLKSLLSNDLPQLREIYFEGVGLERQMGVALVSHLPRSLERLALLGTHLGDGALTFAKKEGCPQIHYLQLYGNKFSFRGIRNLVQMAPNTSRLQMVGQVELAGKSPESDLSWVGRSLPALKQVWLSNVPLGNQKMTQIFGGLPVSVRSIDLSSTGLELKGLQALISKIPKDVQELSIAGNDIGDVGLELFRAFQKNKEEKTKLPVVLRE